MPSWAVTTIVIVFEPNDKGILADAVPDTTVTPFTVMIEVASMVVGVTVIDDVVLLTLAL